MRNVMIFFDHDQPSNRIVMCRLGGPAKTDIGEQHLKMMVQSAQKRGGRLPKSRVAPAPADPPSQKAAPHGGIIRCDGNFCLEMTLTEEHILKAYLLDLLIYA